MREVSRQETPAATPAPFVFDRQALEDRGYWIQRLSEPFEAVGLAEDFRRLPETSAKAAECFFRVDGDLFDRLQRLTKGGPFLLNTTLVSVLSLTLARYTAQRKVILGTPARKTDTGEDLVNALPVSVEIDLGITFKQLLMKVREVLLEVYSRQRYPVGRLIDDLGLAGAAEQRCPLFDLSLSVDQIHGPMAEVGDHTHVAVRAKEDHLEGTIHFDGNLYRAGTLESFAQSFQTLLEAGLRNLDAPLRGLSMLTSIAELELIGTWSSTAREYPRDTGLVELFEAQVACVPEAEALRFGERSVTYRELDHRANGLAWELRRRGVVRGTLVAICCERGIDLVVGLVAILKAGGAYVPLDPTFPAERLAFMVEDTEVAVLVAQEALIQDLPMEEDVTVVLLGEDLEEEEGPELVADGGDPAYVVYTSGSTGRPKGVLVPQRAIGRLICNTDYVELEPSDRIGQASTFSFDAATFELWGALLVGGCLVEVPLKVVLSPESLGEYLKETGITTLFLTTTLFNQVVSRCPKAFDSLRYLLYGGEATDPNQPRSVLQEGGPDRLLHVYGPTEVTTFALSHRVVEVPEGARTVPLGQAIANTTAFIADRRLLAVPMGAVGELVLGGDGLASGYLNRPALTAERFIPNPFSEEVGARLYRTGDQVRGNDQKTIEFLGRLDNQVKLRGFRIELGEIEQALQSHSAVQAAVVQVRELGSEGDRQLVAYAQHEDGEQEPTPADLRQYLGHRLPEYMLPSQVFFLPKLPTTATGKLDRRGLPAPEEMLGKGKLALAPRNPIERKLVEIWQDLLGHDRVSLDDNFFELGGHSLLAVQMASRVREAFLIDLPIETIFGTPTLEGQAAYLVDALGKSGSVFLAPPVTSVPRDGELPLSFAQQRFWFLDQLEPGSSAYNVSSASRLVGCLHVPALERTLQALVMRHEILRTVFPSVDGRPVQLVEGREGSPLPWIDLRSLPVEERESALVDLVTQERHFSFDLEAGPLFRYRLIILGKDEHVLLISMHHITSDGWSLGLLSGEIAQLYGAFVSGEPSPLEELAIQYADYAAWQRSWISGDVLAKQLQYWRDRLAGLPPCLSLPTDRPRPAARNLRGDVVPVEVETETVEALLAFGKREGVTLFMVLLAGFETLLYRYSGERDFAIGSPLAGRTRVETEPLVGCFVNTLVLRADLHGDPTFSQLLGRVRSISAEAQENQDLPFEKLVDELEVERTLSHTPLFQVMISLQNTLGGQAPLGDLEVTPVDGWPALTALFDLTLTLDTAEGLLGNLEYSTDLFDLTTIVRMEGHLQVLLAAAAADPNISVSRLPLWASAERHQVVAEWNDAPILGIPDGCFHDAFAAVAERWPERPALVFRDQHLSFGELDKRSNRLAHHLRRLGVRPEVPVGLCLDSGLDLLVGLLAVLKAGGAYVPMDPANPEERLAYIVEDAAARVVLTLEQWASRLKKQTGIVVVLDDENAPWAEEETTVPVSEARPDNLAYIIYTSGSTGRPKGTSIRHRGLLNLANAWRRRLGTEAEPMQVGVTSTFAFDASVTQMAQLLHGHTLHILPEEARHDGEALVRHLRGVSLDLLDGTPSQLQFWLAAGLLETPGVAPRQFIVGGEALEAHLWKELASSEVAAFNAYGPTECTVDVAASPLLPEFSRPTLGRPLANVRCHVVEPPMAPSPLGVPGELVVGGIGLARGYLRQPRLTAERFVPNPLSSDFGDRLYRTGDLVRYLPNGNLEFLGRLDQQVKLRGFRIELGEIESVLLEHPEVSEAVVELRENVLTNRSTQALVAYLVGQEGAPVPVEGVRDLLKERLPDYMVPSSFVALEALPLTLTGKVNRKALPDPEARGEAEGSFLVLRDPVEELHLTIWKEVLQVEEIGMTDNFFDLGGHSLLATQLTSRLQKAFGIDLPVRAVFEHSTVRQLAQLVNQEMAGGDRALVAPDLEPVPRDRPLPLSFAQQRLWFIDQFEPESSVYNIPTALHLLGELNFSALERSLQEIVRRHEVLRTIFRAEDGEPVQVILPFEEAPLPVHDLGGLPSVEAEEEMRHIVEAAMLLPFRLADEPQLRSHLVRLSESEYVVVLVIHHIISDGWSLGILVNEITLLYDAFSRGEPSPLPRLSVQYADFAEWQRKWLVGAGMDAQLAYWRERLAGLPPVLELPTDRPRSNHRTSRGDILRVDLPLELSTALLQLNRSVGVTLFMSSLAAFQALLYRYSHQSSIAVGTPMAGRNRLDTEAVIGFFINTLVLRADIRADMAFSELLEQVRDRSLEAHTHQDLPFEKLVEELQPERSLSHSPLFQTMFVLQNLPTESRQFPNLEVRTVQELPTVTAVFDLVFTLVENQGKMGGWLHFSRDLFDPSTMERMARHFEILLEGVVASPESPISSFSILTRAERVQLVEEWNPPAAELSGPAVLYERFLARAAQVAERPAVVYGERAVSYGELVASSQALARQLVLLGVAAESPVALFLDRGVELVEGFLGILASGGAYLPLDPSYPAERLAYQL